MVKSVTQNNGEATAEKWWYVYLWLGHPFRNRFLPCFAGMVMIATEELANSLPNIICLRDSGIVMVCKEVQNKKAYSSMSAMDSPMVMLFKEVHLAKAKLPMYVTDSPKLILFRDLHPTKACLPMWVTDLPKVMLSREVQFWKAYSSMSAMDSPMVMLFKEVHLAKATLPMCVTDSPKLMLSKNVQSSKAFSPIFLTDAGIVSRASWWELWKTALELFVALEGIFTAKLPDVGMSCFVAASTMLLVYATVTWDSALKNPAELRVSGSTLRTLRSIGSWQGCFSRSIAFKSRIVVVMGRSRVMTPPCKVFNLTSQDMAASQNLWQT